MIRFALEQGERALYMGCEVLAHRVEDFAQRRIAELVQGLAAFAPALHKPPSPEKSQVLREVGWANAGLADKRADRLLAGS